MKILIIEDEVNIITVLEKYLKSENYEVIHAENGKAGLEMFFNESPDFIILDLMLPDITGLSICTEIRKVSNVPIIILTAKRHVSDKVIGLTLGADDYISKPFSPKEIIARIETIKRRIGCRTCLNTNNTWKNQTPIKGLYLNEEKRMFFLDRNALELTATEFDILVLLYNNYMRIFKRNELLDKISTHTFPIDRNIDVHIRNIRKKLHDDSKIPKYIKTIWGVGYQYIGKNEHYEQ